MKEYFQLYFLFFKLGIVNFGGGYALLPLLDKELCEKRNWATSQELADYYAIGQCTPGAMAVNVSTFIGIKRKGVLGGVLATLGFVSPAFIIIFLIASVLTGFNDNVYVINALGGIRVCVFFLVLNAIIKLSKKSLTDLTSIILAIIIAALAIFVKAIPLYCYVIFAAIFGLVFNIIKEKTEKKKYENIKPKEENIVISYEPLIKNNDDNGIEKIEYVEEDIKEDNVEEKHFDSKLFIKRALIYITGFIVGLVFGILGLISTLFIKKKEYKNGVFSTFYIWIALMLALTIFLICNFNTISFELYLHFFKVGICAFGGGLATFPFLEELGRDTNWFSINELADMIAVSESTPGAMGVNMSTYVGYTTIHNEFDNFGLSFMGSMISTIGLVSPSILVIIAVSSVLTKFRTNKYVEYLFKGLRPASIGLMIAALYSILKVAIFKQYAKEVDGVFKAVDALKYSFDISFKDLSWSNLFSSIGDFFYNLIDYKALAIGLLFGIGIFKFKKHPLIYIAIAAVTGIVLQMGTSPIIVE